MIELHPRQDITCLSEYFRSASANDKIFILGNEGTARIAECANIVRIGKVIGKLYGEYQIMED